MVTAINPEDYSRYKGLVQEGKVVLCAFNCDDPRDMCLKLEVIYDKQGLRRQTRSCVYQIMKFEGVWLGIGLHNDGDKLFWVSVDRVHTSFNDRLDSSIFLDNGALVSMPCVYEGPESSTVDVYGRGVRVLWSPRETVSESDPLFDLAKGILVDGQTNPTGRAAEMLAEARKRVFEMLIEGRIVPKAEAIKAGYVEPRGVVPGSPK
jgi:hypothetical protein